MGRPIGSPNREKPFNDMLRVAVRGRPFVLRRIADKLLDGAEQGNLAYIRELVDRPDGKAAQVIDHGEIPLVTQLTDSQLHEIAAGVLPEKDEQPKALPPPRKFREP